MAAELKERGMAELPRLNGVIGALEKGQHALTTFTPADVESAIALAAAKYDAVVYEMEHNRPITRWPRAAIRG